MGQAWKRHTSFYAHSVGPPATSTMGKRGPAMCQGGRGLTVFTTKPGALHSALCDLFFKLSCNQEDDKMKLGGLQQN